MTENIDNKALRLEDYPHPSLAVDPIVLTVENNKLCLAVEQGPSMPSLPGTFVHQGETLIQAANRALEKKLGLGDINLRQLHVFDAPGRDPRGWVFSVAHLALVRPGSLNSSKVLLLPVDQLPAMAYDHVDMVQMALTKVREEYLVHPDPWDLLDVFTLKELRELHLAIVGEAELPARDTFRRMMEPQLSPTGEMSTGSVGKPSRLFTKASKQDLFDVAMSEPKSERSRRISSSLKITSPRKRSAANYRDSSVPERLMPLEAMGSMKYVEPDYSETLFDAMRQEYAVPVDSTAFLNAPSWDSEPETETADFAVELYWEKRPTSVRNNLTLEEAEKVFETFRRRLSTSLSEFPPDERPTRLLLRDSDGTLRQEEHF